MAKLTHKFATLAIAAMAVSHGALPVRAGDAAQLVKPAHGISLLSGSKRAIGYYTADAGACDLTVMISDAFEDHKADESPAAARVSTVVGAGTTTKVDTADGTSLAFTCAEGAKSISVRTVDRVAYKAAPKG